MRLLIFSQYFSPENFPINEIARTLIKKKLIVEILTGKPNYPDGQLHAGYSLWGSKDEQFHGAPLFRVPLIPRGKNSALGLAMNYLSFVLFGIACSPWLLRGRTFDVIFVYAPSPILQAIPAIFLGWLKGCPVVLWVQDLWPESLSATGYVKNKLALKIVERVVRFIYRHVDLLLVQSEAFIAPVSKLASGTPVTYHPNSVNGSFSVPASAAVPDIPGLGHGFSVMFTGNIGSAQAVEVIVEAANLLKEYADIQFVILGDGSRRDWMMQEVCKRGLTNLHLPGRFPLETMPGFMQKASALLVTLADQEIFTHTIPSKVQAYLAAGQPILACLNGEGASLIAKTGAGLTAPAQDAQALAQAVLKLYRMTPQERNTMGAKGRLYYEQHFSHDILADRLIGLLQSCITDTKEKSV